MDDTGTNKITISSTYGKYEGKSFTDALIAERKNITEENQRLRKLLEDVVHLHDWGGVATDWRHLVALIVRELSDV